MNLGELLEQLREGILNDRSDQTSGDSDYLWTDATLTRYIDEAQRRLAVRGLVIRDASTPECCDITLVAGQSAYPLHEAVIAVVSAKRTDVDHDLTRVGHAVLAGYRSPTDNWVDPLRYSALQPGAPVAYSTDEEIGLDDAGSMGAMTLRVYPTPDADAAGAVIRMRVIRKPLVRLADAAPTAAPEVPEDHHLDMLDWAAYLALRIVDDDAGAPARAQEFKDSFEKHVREARTLVMRKLFAPQPWRVGGNGFSWER